MGLKIKRPVGCTGSSGFSCSIVSSATRIQGARKLYRGDISSLRALARDASRCCEINGSSDANSAATAKKTGFSRDQRGDEANPMLLTTTELAARAMRADLVYTMQRMQIIANREGNPFGIAIRAFGAATALAAARLPSYNFNRVVGLNPAEPSRCKTSSPGTPTGAVAVH